MPVLLSGKGCVLDDGFILRKVLPLLHWTVGSLAQFVRAADSLISGPTRVPDEPPNNASLATLKVASFCVPSLFPATDRNSAGGPRADMCGRNRGGGTVQLFRTARPR